MFGFDSLTGGGALSGGGSSSSTGDTQLTVSPTNEINFANKSQWQTFAVIAVGIVLAAKIIKGK